MFKLGRKLNSSKARVRFQQVLVVLSLLLAFKYCDLLTFSDPDYRSDHIPGSDIPLSAHAITVISSGLTNGQIILQNTANSDTLTVSGAGSFSFPQLVDAGDPYSIVIQQNDTYPQQSCMITNGSGTMPNNDINTVLLNCAVNTYSVSGTITGLAPSTSTSLVLQLNGGNDYTIAAGSTSFTFPQEVPQNTIFNVTIKTHPAGPSQNCVVSTGTGIVPVYNTPFDPSSGLAGGTGDATGVVVSCVTNSFAVAYNVTGLAGSGLQVSLQSPPGTTVETQSVDANGSLVFDTLLADLSSYQLVVTTNPTVLSQSCTFGVSTGALNGADVSPFTHALNCVTNSYSISANISGVNASNTVTLSLNAGAGQTYSTTGIKNLGSLADGTFYSVSITGTTGTISCAVNPSSGVLAGASITVAVTCAANTWTVGGSITGYAGGNSGLVLRLNGGNDLTITGGSTSFLFPTALAEGSNYAVTVKNHPSTTLQLCTVTNSSGTNITANIGNVAVTCGVDNPPSTPAITTSTTGYFQGGTTFLTATYSDDSQNSTNFPTYSSFYTYSYNWQTSTSGCTISGGTSSTASVNCTWGAEEAARIVAIRVGFSDGRNAMVYSGYSSIKVFNPAFTFATSSGSTIANRGLDPDLPGDIQTAIDTAYNNSGRTKVAVQRGSYTITVSPAVTMRNGISVYGRYYTDWTNRYAKSTTNHLSSTYSSVINHNYASTYGRGFSLSSISSSTVLDGMTLITPNQLSHYGFFISGGSPVVRNNYYVSNTTTGFTTSAYHYGVYCSSCYARMENNLFDIYYGTGVMIYYASASGPTHLYNNVIRMDQGLGIRIYYTAANSVYAVNNTIMNRYATKNTGSVGFYLYGSASTDEPIGVYILNNNISAMYGAYEASAYANPRILWNNNFNGPTGYTAYYDYQGVCTANADGDSNPNTCTALEGNAKWSTIVYTGGDFYGNFSLSPAMRYSLSSFVVGSASDSGFYIGDYYGSDTSMLYGARTWSTYFTDDFLNITRTYSIPAGNVWTASATPYGPAGATIGAYEQ